MHKVVHSSSESYLTSVSQGKIPYPLLNGFDHFTLFMLLILFLDVCFGKRSVMSRLSILVTGFLGTFNFLIYYAGGRLSGVTLHPNR